MDHFYNILGTRKALAAITLAGVIAVSCLLLVTSRIAAGQEADRVAHEQEVKAYADNAVTMKKNMSVLFSGKGW
jgi:hypothetical protein